MELHKSLYGKTALSAGGVGLGTEIVESAILFDSEKSAKKEAEVKPVQDQNGSANAEKKHHSGLVNGTSVAATSKVCCLFYCITVIFPIICYSDCVLHSFLHGYF